MDEQAEPVQVEYWQPSKAQSLAILLGMVGAWAFLFVLAWATQ